MILDVYGGNGDVSGVSVDIFSFKKKNLKKELFVVNEFFSLFGPNIYSSNHENASENSHPSSQNVLSNIFSPEIQELLSQVLEPSSIHPGNADDGNSTDRG